VTHATYGGACQKDKGERRSEAAGVAPLETGRHSMQNTTQTRLSQIVRVLGFPWAGGRHQWLWPRWAKLACPQAMRVTDTL
jgi:hypothetical protein